MATKIEKGKPRFHITFGWLVLLLINIALLLSGCRTATSTPKTTTQPLEPFSARRESEDGAIVAWSGSTKGYIPGAETKFNISIKNETDQIWSGRFCLQLLDQQLPEVITTLEQRPFILEPGVGFSDTITVRFPQDLGEGAYGLSLAVRRPAGPMVDLVPIQIGETGEVRRTTTQQDMDASLEACPPVEAARPDIETVLKLAIADLAQRLGRNLEDIEVKSIEEATFSDASLGVPEPDKVYAQVVTPGYIIKLAASGDTYIYHSADNRVVYITQSTRPDLEVTGEIEIPSNGAKVTLPLHILAHVEQPNQQVTVTLRWQNGTELSQTFTTLQDDKQHGLLIGSLSWMLEGPPPQPENQKASLIIQDESQAVLAQQPVLVLSHDDPGTQVISLYWLLGETLQAETRHIVKTDRVEAATLEELLWGPPPLNLAGFSTAIPFPEEVLSYPGRGPDWGSLVVLRGLTIENGVAIADFSKEINAYGGGSARVLAIREQITQTLKEFPSVKEVVIAVEGETEGILQP